MSIAANDDTAVLGHIVDECLDRHGRGEPVSLNGYLDRFPHLAGRLRELNSVLAFAWSAANAKLDCQAPVLTGFRIIREVGRGGMGVVYEAIEESLGRRVALKVLPNQLMNDPECLARFQREAQTASRLHHTHIVPVFGVGQQDGVHYFVMQFIAGVSPKAGVAMEPNRVADWGAKLADALAYAHSQGVLHRDVKPSNVLIDEHGAPWLADFGLARQDDGPALTETGRFLGTLRYAAPERLNGHADARGDIYGLGTTLYEWAVGQPAFAGGDTARLTQQIASDEPAHPRRINSKIPRDLETVILKAMAKDPARRYQTASELADDLRRVVSFEPIRARRIGPLGRLRRWAGRNPVIAALLLSLILVMTSGTAVVAWKWREAVANAERAENEARAAKEARNRAFRRAEAFYIGMGNHFEFAMQTPANLNSVPTSSAHVAKVFHSLRLVYEEFIDGQATDPEEIALQARAALQVSTLLAVMNEHGSSRKRIWHAVQLINRIPKEDELRTEIYLAWTRGLGRDTNPELYQECYERTLEYFQSRHRLQPADPKATDNLALVYRMHSIALAKSGETIQARVAARSELDILLNALEIAAEPRSKSNFRDVCLRLGRIHLELGEMREAIEVAEIAEKFDDWKIAADILIGCRERSRLDLKAVSERDPFGDRAMDLIKALCKTERRPALGTFEKNWNSMSDRADFQELKRKIAREKLKK